MASTDDAYFLASAVPELVLDSSRVHQDKALDHSLVPPRVAGNETNWIGRLDLRTRHRRLGVQWGSIRQLCQYLASQNSLTRDSRNQCTLAWGLSAKETSRSSGMYSIYLAVLQQKLVPRLGTNLMPEEGVMLTPVAVRFEALWSIWYCYASETRNRLSYLFVYLSITLVHSLRCVVG